MPQGLQKIPIDIPFSKGLDTKTDRFRVAYGKFLALKNSIFGKNRLQKRNGFGELTPLPDSSYRIATTFNNNLTAIGTVLQAYSEASQKWVEKGTLVPVALSTLSLISSNTNQSQADAAVSANGLVCTVFTDDGPSSTTYKYAVASSETGQNLIAPTIITEADATYGAPKVFVLGNFFIIVFTNIVTATYHLKYFSISTVSLAVTSPVDISTSYTPATTVAFDGIVANNNLYLAWNGSDGGGAIRLTYIDATLTQHATVTIATKVATIVSVTADTTTSTPVIYVSYYNLGTALGYTAGFNQQLSVVFASQSIIASGTVTNITSAASDGVATVIWENSNSYAYGGRSDTLTSVTVTQAGVVGSPAVFVRSVGLASKAFAIDGEIYFLAVYSSTYQPTYFLLNSSGKVVAKLAYSNGGSYLTKGLPGVSVFGSVASVAYLIQDQIVPVNKSQTASSSLPVYTQLGVNLASFEVGSAPMHSAEIARNLHLTGGFVWMYDGYVPVEHGFHLWPDVVSAGVTIGTDPTPTGNTTNSSKTITNVSSITNIAVGMSITGAGIPANTTVESIASGTSITISNAATAIAASVPLTLTGHLTNQQYFYAATYEWSDNQGNIFRSAPSIPQTVTASAGHSFSILKVPTLRLTYKTANPVKICLYRWSTAQQVYYQVTSVTQPTLNSTTADIITFLDIKSDAQIIGNSILYTTGGVIENIAAPAARSIDLFDTRAWVIDAEDNNLLWFSKQVVQGVPVEWSDLLTMYVPPSTASEGSTGPMRCLAPMDDKQCIFKPSAIYYVNGKGPDNTGANNQYSEPVFITSTVGTSNQASIVFQPNGLMFQADNGKGIWLLGRDLSTSYIGADVEAFNTATVLSAIAVPGTNQVRFTLDNGYTLMYDYYYGQWGTFTNIPAIYSTIYQSLQTFVDSYGRVFQETPGEYLDGGNPVCMGFTTAWINIAGVQGLQRAYYATLIGDYLSPHRLQINVAFNYNPSASQSTIFDPTNVPNVYGDGGQTVPGSNPPYGSGDVYGTTEPVEQERIFFDEQKCQSIQISLEEIFDPSWGLPAGAGFELSGLCIQAGIKKGAPTLSAAKSRG